ncbi:cobyrinate a,c-diamide synthase [Paenibacillus hamazuiensis]|uniref:cobyrinate a,c-diamide synthase n=1 Tax=Paenibacillus hamazuiensis TaxID=2936508 RepID=UPI00200DE780|nr:cobyrinate a,c-diamide synthase [Paenibacillus hamazuiensis]
MSETRPRFVVAGTGSGSGKTTVTIGLMAALQRRGLQVQGFKCGPDYIDPTYHTAVTGRQSRNLDTWMLTHDTMKEIFLRGSAGADVSVIEGVMGMFDGKDPLSDAGSTAEIAALLDCPVLLVVNAQSMARSAAAIVLGFMQMAGPGRIAGVIANKCGSAGHFKLVKAAIEQECGIPVLGWLGRDDELQVPERHLGLVPAVERGELAPLFRRAAELTRQGVDLDALLALAGGAPALDWPERQLFAAETRGSAGSRTGGLSGPASFAGPRSTIGLDDQRSVSNIDGLADRRSPGGAESLGDPHSTIGPEGLGDPHSPAGLAGPRSPAGLAGPRSPAGTEDSGEGDPGPIPVIAVAKDAAFNFYYPENLELLEQLGACLRLFSPLAGEAVPDDADGVYIGGGFPEEFASRLAENRHVREDLKKRAEAGLPLFAECGGYMYLTRSITDRAGVKHEMAGLIPAEVRMQPKLAALGYREVKGLRDSLLLAEGETIRGHEFHYSTLTVDISAENDFPYAYETKGLRGAGKDGYGLPTLTAGYTHVHFASNVEAARRFVRQCALYGEKRRRTDGLVRSEV